MMELAFFEKLLTTYGPLGLGWIAAAIIWRRHAKLSDRVLEVVERNTASMAVLAEIIKHRDER